MGTLLLMKIFLSKKMSQSIETLWDIYKAKTKESSRMKKYVHVCVRDTPLHV